MSTHYVLNLVYNGLTQIELFRYLFPLCLVQWHETVLAGGYGDHFKESLVKAPHRPYPWQEMMNASQCQQVWQSLLDIALQRMDNERSFNNVLCWLAVFNTLGGTAPLIRSLWSRWWALDMSGKAVCTIQHAVHLVYPIEANPSWLQE